MTARRVVTTRRADEDIDAAVESYRAAATGTALEFINAVEAAVRLIGEHPSIGSLRYAVETQIPELRGFALRRFPYVIFYSLDPDAVRIHRLLHTSRDLPAELV